MLSTILHTSSTLCPRTLCANAAVPWIHRLKPRGRCAFRQDKASDAAPEVPSVKGCKLIAPGSNLVATQSSPILHSSTSGSTQGQTRSSSTLSGSSSNSSTPAPQEWLLLLGIDPDAAGAIAVVSCPIPHSTAPFTTPTDSSKDTLSDIASPQRSSKRMRLQVPPPSAAAAVGAVGTSASCLCPSDQLLHGQALDIAAAADIRVYDMPMMSIPMAKKGRFRR